MSVETAMNAVLGLVLGAAGIALLRWCRAPRPTRAQRAAARQQLGASVWDAATDKWVRLEAGARPGPGQLTARQLDELDQLEVAWLAPAYDAAGVRRLRDAVRDEQQGGDSA
jgi:hypothetical protein